MIPSTAELLLAWDAQRPRSQQQEMGMSGLGGCRRRAGYQTQGYEPDPEFEQGLQPVLGTAIHEIAAAAARMFVPGAQVEDLEVHFGGLTGHPDLFYDGTVRDIKTVGHDLQIEQRRANGPQQRERWQVQCYGAGLMMDGYQVREVEINWVARASGLEHIWREPFSVAVVAEAMAWLDDVQSSAIELLPRDYRPESGTCKGCPWFRRCWDAEPGHDLRSVLFVDDPDAYKWAQMMDDARQQRKISEADAKDAEGALDALRTVSEPGQVQEIEVPGLGKVIRFRVNKGRTSPDMAKIAVDYERAGARPPMKVGEPAISVTLVAKRKREG